MNDHDSIDESSSLKPKNKNELYEEGIDHSSTKIPLITPNQVKKHKI